jgi:hypothetical protein
MAAGRQNFGNHRPHFLQFLSDGLVVAQWRGGTGGLRYRPHLRQGGLRRVLPRLHQGFGKKVQEPTLAPVKFTEVNTALGLHGGPPLVGKLLRLFFCAPVTLVFAVGGVDFNTPLVTTTERAIDGCSWSR